MSFGFVWGSVASGGWDWSWSWRDDEEEVGREEGSEGGGGRSCCDFWVREVTSERREEDSDFTWRFVSYDTVTRMLFDGKFLTFS